MPPLPEDRSGAEVPCPPACQHSGGHEDGSGLAKRRSNWDRIAKWLVACGGAVLLGWFSYHYPVVREVGVTWLGKLGPPAVPLLRRALDDPNHDVRVAALEALLAIGPRAVPSLIDSLDDADPTVRAQAALALTWLGPRAKDAAGPLTQALEDDDPRVRVMAVRSQYTLSIRPQEALPRILKALHDPDPMVRAEAVGILGRIEQGPNVGARVALLVEALRDESPHVRAAGAEALGRYGLRAKEAMAALIEAAGDAEPRVRYQVHRALERMMAEQRMRAAGGGQGF